jgi:hypothetical protein
MKALNLLPSRNMEEYMNLKKAALSMFGRDLVDYEIEILDHQSYEMHLKRCFAHENIVKAGIKDQYECGIFSRLQGWIDAQGLEHELTPPLAQCMRVLGKECRYNVAIRFH